MNFDRIAVVACSLCIVGGIPARYNPVEVHSHLEGWNTTVRGMIEDTLQRQKEDIEE